MAELKMTLYQALAKKKILVDKLEKMESNRMVAVRKKMEPITLDNMTIEEAEKSIKSTYDSTVAIINNYYTLCAAINTANALTKVTIAGKEYSIADAIIRQRNLDIEESLYKRMLSNIAGCKREIEKNNERYLTPEKISDHVSKVLGDSKKDDELIQKTTDTYVNTWSVELFDPMNTEELATKKLEDIAEFREEIHAALTQINCTTEITVVFED